MCGWNRCVEASFQPSLWMMNKWRRHIKALSHRRTDSEGITLHVQWQHRGLHRRAANLIPTCAQWCPSDAEIPAACVIPSNIYSDTGMQTRQRGKNPSPGACWLNALPRGGRCCLHSIKNVNAGTKYSGGNFKKCICKRFPTWPNSWNVFTI